MEHICPCTFHSWRRLARHVAPRSPYVLCLALPQVSVLSARSASTLTSTRQASCRSQHRVVSIRGTDGGFFLARFSFSFRGGAALVCRCPRVEILRSRMCG